MSRDGRAVTPAMLTSLGPPLRREVVLRAEQREIGVGAVELSGQPEVGEPDGSVRHEQDVGRRRDDAARPRQAEANPAYVPPWPATASTFSRPRAPCDSVMNALTAPRRGSPRRSPTSPRPPRRRWCRRSHRRTRRRRRTFLVAWWPPRRKSRRSGPPSCPSAAPTSVPVKVSVVSTVSLQAFVAHGVKIHAGGIKGDGELAASHRPGLRHAGSGHHPHRDHRRRQCRENGSSHRASSASSPRGTVDRQRPGVASGGVTASRRLPPVRTPTGRNRGVDAPRGSDEPQGEDRNHEDNDRGDRRAERAPDQPGHSSPEDGRDHGDRDDSRGPATHAESAGWTGSMGRTGPGRNSASPRTEKRSRSSFAERRVTFALGSPTPTDRPVTDFRYRRRSGPKSR